MNKKSLSKIINELGEDRSRYFNAVAPPVIQTSNFAFPNVQSFKDALSNELANHLYSRGNNPTVAILRKKLAALSGAEDALVFSSGTAAICAAVIANVSSGDHVICVKNPYSWTNKLFTEFLPRFDINTSFIDGTKIEQFENAIQSNTKLIWLESPNSLTFECQDLKKVAELAKAHNIITGIDNSYASPLYQRPLEMGIDISMHTITKYLNGHSDVVAGVICSNSVQIKKIFAFEFMGIGAVLPPHEAAMVIRGLRTLPIRMERINSSTKTMFDYLKNHPKVESIIYPYDENFTQYDLAKAQMSGAPGLLTIKVKSDSIHQMEKFVNRFKRFLMAVSWGGYESLILPFVIFHGSDYQTDKPYNMIRVYIGLEDPAYLIEDFEQAFEVL
ncbi:MAG: aminotransferase class I/II-fold pyridoxal phosphate-dependent enzyme [Bacteroidota bacterium]